MTDIMTLAGSLRARDDASLERLLTRRPLPARGRVKDFFDLAEVLLDPVSIRGILHRLDRHTLAVLAAATLEPQSAQELAARVGASDEHRRPRCRLGRDAHRAAE